ncbi:MAG: L-lactate dehydrogenase [Spirochaetota bacterium]
MQHYRNKIAIIGAGQVGSSFAYALMISGLVHEMVLIDKNEKRAQGEAMDLNHGLSFTDPARIYAGDYSECAGADVIVITAGANQDPGQTRLDLVQNNTNIFKSILNSVTPYLKEDAIILVVTNPVDILTCFTIRYTGLPPSRVFGSGTVLDSSRFRYLLSQHCEIDPRNVHAYIIGEHGDSEVPLWSSTNIAGVPIHDYCPVCLKSCDSKVELNQIFENVKNAAYQIIDAKGSTYYAIGLAIVRIVRAILRDENAVLPVSVLLEDYYGISDVCLSIPSIINRKGFRQVLPLRMSEEEIENLKKSADVIKEMNESTR